MTILQLKYFEAVYAARSMTRAAERLYVSQPSVSTAIKELEEEIGAQLFLRTNPLHRMRTRPPAAWHFYYR